MLISCQITSVRLIVVSSSMIELPYLPLHRNTGLATVKILTRQAPVVFFVVSLLDARLPSSRVLGDILDTSDRHHRVVLDGVIRVSEVLLHESLIELLDLDLHLIVGSLKVGDVLMLLLHDTHLLTKLLAQLQVQLVVRGRLLDAGLY